ADAEARACVGVSPPPWSSTRAPHHSMTEGLGTMPYNFIAPRRERHSAAVERIMRVTQSALDTDDDRKGALTVRALLDDLSNDEVLSHLVDQGVLTTVNSIRFYRTGLRLLGF